MSSNEQAKASKEKTREIKVWVDKDRIREIEQGQTNNARVWTQYPLSPAVIEATLLIKEPEKTVTISESEYHQMTRDFDNPKAMGAFRFWYEKLFGSQT